MRIFIISHYSDLYGANRSMCSVIEYLQEKGHTVLLLLPSKGSIVPYLEKKGIKFIIIPYFSQFLYVKCALRYIILPLLWVLNIVATPLILAKILSFKPNLIYSNSSAESLGIIMSKITGIKHVLHVREFMSLDYKAYFIAGESLKRKYINKSNGVIYNSESVAKYILSNKERTNFQTVIHNGIEIPSYNYEAKEIPKNINIGIVGILDPAKGQDLALNLYSNIVQKYPNSSLNIWGNKEGAYKEKILNYVAEKKLTSNVIFHGFEKNADTIYQNMDLLLMCSKSEAFGRVTVEAMMRAIPVIGLNNAGTAEIIEHSQTGYLFKTTEEFIFCFDSLFSSEENYNKIRKNAYETARTKFTTRIYCNRVESFLNQICNLV